MRGQQATGMGRQGQSAPQHNPQGRQIMECLGARRAGSMFNQLGVGAEREKTIKGQRAEGKAE